MPWPAPSSTANVANCGNVTVKARKTSSTHSASSVNMIVLWNTIYMQAALNLHRADGHSVRPEDEARLSPLGHEHINLLGRYSFAVPESVARGELRPLRNPADGGR